MAVCNKCGEKYPRDMAGKKCSVETSATTERRRVYWSGKYVVKKVKTTCGGTIELDRFDLAAIKAEEEAQKKTPQEKETAQQEAARKRMAREKKVAQAARAKERQATKARERSKNNSGKSRPRKSRPRR